MSLGIVFKGPEGVVLAADSRVTLTANLPNNVFLPAYFDNATKLLRIRGQDFAGVVTYGQGALGQAEPRTAHSYIPEFEAELGADKVGRLGIKSLADRLGRFFLARWNQANMPAGADPLYFLVAGFDQDATYGRVFLVAIPGAPEAVEQSPNLFGIVYGGQTEYVQRLLNGYDGRLPDIATKALNLTPAQKTTLEQALPPEVGIRIPYQFLPLQDCIDLSIFLIRTTVSAQRWTVGIRGVGGFIDVATITRTEGFEPVQEKQIRGEPGDSASR
ncbi:MAG: hypothetical protein E6I70_09735 [Chloroflexi bacterium]|nr:MAG: hypothetical protein E6I70_09735 [Chloroflexota bacterium]